MLRSQGCRGTACLLLALSVASATSAGEVTVRLEFPPPAFRAAGVYEVIDLPGAWNYGDPGEPEVPRCGVQVLLPPGEEVTGVDLVSAERVPLAGTHVLRPGQVQGPLSSPGPERAAAPDPRVYRSSDPYPAECIAGTSTHFACGHGIGAFAFCPVEYVPSSGQVTLLRDVEIRVTTGPTPRAERARDAFYRGTRGDEERVRNLVRNPSALSAYRGGEPLAEPRSRQIVDPAEDYDLVIITSAALESAFSELADFKTARGIRTAVVLLSDIHAAYAGADPRVRIRSFIADAYSGWGIRYVLLAGDDDTIPHRGLYALAYGMTDADIASDLYYGALDGDWNGDGDGHWGEPGEDDLVPEVHVGRAAVDDVTEAAHFVDKVILYEDAPVVADCGRALMVGELLWDDPTWGGDYKDEVKNGSSANGYTTVGFAAGDMQVSTLYDRDLGTWSKFAVLDSLNHGTNLVNHIGHCGPGYALRMYSGDVQSGFTNDGTNHGFFVIYSQGCYMASFDNKNEYGVYGDDCISEYFTTVSKAAVAVVSNTRYGWGEHFGTNGASQFYDRQFFDALFGEGLTTLGECNDDSKVDNIPFVSFGAIRWCYYDLVVLGDPTLDLWTAAPAALSVSHAGVIPTGPTHFSVTVSGPGSAPIEGAVVCLTKGTEAYEVGTTGASGRVSFDLSLATAGTMAVTVTKHDFLAYHGEVGVTGDAQAPLVAVFRPDGGEVLEGGGVCEIEWVRWDNVGVVSTTLLLSTDGGTTYSDTLASGGVESPWTWHVPDVPEEHCRVKVVCRDAGMNEGWDSSEGDFEIASATGTAEGRSIPPHLRLGQNRPNPFNPETEIEFALPSGGEVALAVYDVEGRRVATLAESFYPAGTHSVAWSGEDASGRRVASGIYFYRLDACGKVLTKKMVVLE